MRVGAPDAVGRISDHMRITLSGSLLRFLSRLGIAVLVTTVVMVAAVEGVRARARDEFDVEFLDEEVGAALDPHAGGAVVTGPDGVVVTATTQRTPPPSAPQNFLLVGTDSRANLSGPGFGSETAAGGSRADVIMIVRVEPQNDFAYVLSIPRDTLVTISGWGRQGRINEALSDRDDPNKGIVRLIETVKDNFQIPIHHYVQVDFSGVEQIVNALGGVTVFLYYPARDAFSGLSVPGGCVDMDGGTALAYARSRHFQEYVDGRWQSDPFNSDLTRSRRQQDLLRRVAITGVDDIGDSLGKLSALVDAVTDPLTLDPTLDFDTALDLARELRDIDPATIQMRTLPVSFTNIEGASYLSFSPSAAEPYLAPFRLGNVPGEVRLRVLDALGGSPAASAVNLALGAAGFRVDDVAASPDEVSIAEVRYVVGQPASLAKAQLVARHLDGRHRLVPVLALEGADVELVVGSAELRVLTAPVAQFREDDLPPTTATTVPVSTSTRPGAPAASSTTTGATPVTGDSIVTTIPVAEQAGIVDADALNVPPTPC